MIKIQFLDKSQRDQIGFTYILDKLQVMTPFGEILKRNLKPFSNKSKTSLMVELNNIENVVKNYTLETTLIDNIERLFCRLKDISNSLKRCENNSILDDVELFEIKNFTLIINELIESFSLLNSKLNLENIRFIALNDTLNLLDPEGRRLPTFHIYDKYSPKLKEIRKIKRTLENRILSSCDEREILSLKEERLKYVLLEEEEELNVRKYLCSEIKKYIIDFKINIKSLGKLDLTLAKSKLAITFNCSRPIISEDLNIHLKNAINPEVDSILKGKGKAFVPITIEVKSGTTIITGANMGGKSISLKTLVLNVLLFQMGFFLFCDKAIIPILDFIYFISDDLQSVHQGLSTFGAEIIKLKQVLAHAKDKNGLIALDEFARGTNPKEGGFLVKSLCIYLNSLKSISIISTHYDNIVEDSMVHYQVIGLKNLDFTSLKRKIDLNKARSVEIIQEHMDYRLELVSNKNSVPKDALNICVLLGLNNEIISISKKFYDESLKKGD